MKNKEVLQAANAAVMKGEKEVFLAFCTDKVVWTFVGDQTLRGKEAVRQYMAQTYLEPPKFEVENMIEEGDYVTAVGTIDLKDRDGNLVNYSYCDVWRFEDGKMAELTAFVIKVA
ncbi:nuclear transport factor 2 family protein [Dyadobacter sp. CY261]|uniref:nuclear transport factor 2 family protein n=1 Tax=Dyadobacter sp. CY261 TaxID=2907203 RepID=UPI001F2D1D24|nr:nuclear transport factor 2 family protein [Dyadobacter sp. CY261]MCF0072700.1 nuclear transport factor 2 family protein [Dyadobacter sp. CY261]